MGNIEFKKSSVSELSDEKKTEFKNAIMKFHEALRDIDNVSPMLSMTIVSQTMADLIKFTESQGEDGKEIFDGINENILETIGYKIVKTNEHFILDNIDKPRDPMYM